MLDFVSNVGKYKIKEWHHARHGERHCTVHARIFSVISCTLSIYPKHFSHGGKTKWLASAISLLYISMMQIHFKLSLSKIQINKTKCNLFDLYYITLWLCRIYRNRLSCFSLWSEKQFDELEWQVHELEYKGIVYKGLLVCTIIPQQNNGQALHSTCSSYQAVQTRAALKQYL